MTAVMICSALPFNAMADDSALNASRQEEQYGTGLADPDPEQNDPLYWREEQKKETGLVGSTAEDSLVHDSRFDTGYEKHYGIDVSKYEGEINWDKVKTSGKDFAIIRMGYRASGNGTIYSDPTGSQNLKGAVKAGLKVGVYIFSQALNEKEAREEADWLLNSVSGYEDSITIPYVMDYEYVGNNTGRLARAKLKRSQASANVNAFVSEIKSRGAEAMLYANTNFLKDQLNTDLIDTNCSYWVARYRTSLGYYGTYSYWQYSESGKVSGVPSDCDLDVWYEPVGSSNSDTNHDVNGSGTDSGSSNSGTSDGNSSNSGINTTGEAASQAGAMYRLYNPNSGEHFYTASGQERNFLIEQGWRAEGTAWTNPDSGIPVYRLYNPNTGDHHYTTSSVERDHLAEVGWNYEGIGWYAAEAGTPVYRLYNPNAKKAGSHHYTTSAGERNSLIEAGWNDEGIGWHAL